MSKKDVFRNKTSFNMYYGFYVVVIKILLPLSHLAV